MLDRRPQLFRHVDGTSEFVVDISHMPVLITTWFGAPSVELATHYTSWFGDYVRHCHAMGKRFVILDDATRAGRPAPPVRGVLSKSECLPQVVIDRVVVSQERAIRGAVTALSWISGKQIKAEDTVEAGVRRCLELLDQAKLARPRDFEWKPAQPS